jgi:hypothetical protein
MRIGKTGSATLATLLAAGLLALGAPAAQAASECKGMERKACERNDRCTWVDGFTRKDGVKVSSHCRKKPSQSSTKKSSTDEKKPASDTR